MQVDGDPQVCVAQSVNGSWTCTLADGTELQFILDDDDDTFAWLLASQLKTPTTSSVSLRLAASGSGTNSSSFKQVLTGKVLSGTVTPAFDELLTGVTLAPYVTTSV